MNEHIVLRVDASSPEGRAFVTREPVICNAVFESVNSKSMGITYRAASRLGGRCHHK